MINILFVCAGNTCRSPMCEYLLKHILQEGQEKKSAPDLINKFNITSCGVCVSTPQPANQNAINAVIYITNNTQITKHLSKPLTKNLIEKTNYIFALDQAVFDYISQIYISQNSNNNSKQNLYLFNSVGIADPYGSSSENYLETALSINIALKNMLKNIFKFEIS